MIVAPMDALTTLEDQALEAEAANRYEPQSKRTVMRVIDATPYAGQPRCRLLVIAAYTNWGEHMATYGNVTALERVHVRPHLLYAVLWEGRLAPIEITRDEAVALVERGELPLALARIEVQADDSDPFAGLVDTPYVGPNRIGKVGTR